MSVAVDEEGLIIGESMMYVHPGWDFGVKDVSIIIYCEKSYIWFVE